VNGAWRNVNFDGEPISFADDHPVVMVSWEDAQAFCAWLSKEGLPYRLPCRSGMEHCRRPVLSRKR